MFNPRQALQNIGDRGDYIRMQQQARMQAPSQVTQPGSPAVSGPAVAGVSGPTPTAPAPLIAAPGVPFPPTGAGVPVSPSSAGTPPMQAAGLPAPPQLQPIQANPRNEFISRLRDMMIGAGSGSLSQAGYNGANYMMQGRQRREALGMQQQQYANDLAMKQYQMQLKDYELRSQLAATERVKQLGNKTATSLVKAGVLPPEMAEFLAVADPKGLIDVWKEHKNPKKNFEVRDFEGVPHFVYNDGTTKPVFTGEVAGGNKEPLVKQLSKMTGQDPALLETMPIKELQGMFKSLATEGGKFRPPGVQQLLDPSKPNEPPVAFDTSTPEGAQAYRERLAEGWAPFEKSGMTVRTPDGTVVEVGGTGKGSGGKTSDLEARNYTYYRRGDAALRRIEAPLPDGTRTVDVLSQYTGNILTDMLGERYSGGVVSDEFREAMIYGASFLEALLRPATGAVINDQETQRYALMFLPQPGESKRVLDAKSELRQVALEAIGQSLFRDKVLAFVEMRLAGVSPEEASKILGGQPADIVGKYRPEAPSSNEAGKGDLDDPFGIMPHLMKGRGR